MIDEKDDVLILWDTFDANNYIEPELVAGEEPQGFVDRVTAEVAGQWRCPKGLVSGGQRTDVQAANCDPTPAEVEKLVDLLMSGKEKIEDSSPAELHALIDRNKEFAQEAVALTNEDIPAPLGTSPIP